MNELLNLDALLVRLINSLPSLISALVIFIASLYLAGILGKAVRRGMTLRQRNQELTEAITKLARLTVIILGTTAALQTIGFNLTAFLAGLGVVGFTIGFALQDVSKNFVAGLLLLLQQPFNIGDVIEVKGFTGTVTDVDLRATVLRTVDGRVVLIPNADVFTNPIVNINRIPTRRTSLELSVSNGSDLEQVRQVGVAAVSGLPGVLSEPPPGLFFRSLGSAVIHLTVFYWVNVQQVDPQAVQDAAVIALESAFRQAEIEMPFPTQVVINK